MRDFRDAKAMAQTLREALKAKSVSLTHSESLELVAKLLGFPDWNVLSARIAYRPAAGAPIVLPLISVGARLPTVPLRDFVVFPKMDAPLLVGREASKRAVEHAMAGDQRILAVTQRRATDENPSPQDLHGIGVMASIMGHSRPRHRVPHHRRKELPSRPQGLHLKQRRYLVYGKSPEARGEFEGKLRYVSRQCSRPLTGVA